MTRAPNSGSSLGPDGDSTEHQQVWELLPWLANGTLEGDELHQVLDHLKVCDVCRDELRFLPELRFVVEQGELASAPGLEPEQPSAGVMERIEAHEAAQGAAVSSTLVERAGARPEPVSDRVVRWWRRRAAARAGHWGAPVLAAQALILLLVVGLGWSGALFPGSVSPGSASSSALPSGEDPVAPNRFTTLSQEALTVEDDPRARLIFAEEVRERELRQLLLDHGATIVDGPNSLGAYTVRWPALDEATLDALRRRPELEFVEPVAGDDP